ncbi:MAG: integrase core domain-containing protein, partial [Actinomycetes bacterium]
MALSIGRTGQCWDNALAESFFASLKGECLDQQPWPTRAAARRGDRGVHRLVQRHPPP